MAFVTSKLKFSTQLYNPANITIDKDTITTAMITFATDWGTNFNSYFSDGLAPPTTVGSYLYTHSSLVTVSTNLINNLKTLFQNTNIEQSQWGNELSDVICNWINTVTFSGTKEMINPPYTSTPWSGTVDSSLALISLKASLTTLYSTPSDDWNAFATLLETYLDTASRLCYLELPAILLQ